METSCALLIFGLCGLAGVLVDTDHLVSILLWKTVDSSITEGRIFHTPLFILACVVICYLVSCVAGLHAKLVLGGVLTLTITVLLYSPLVIWSWY